MECAKSELRGKVTKIALKAGKLIGISFIDPLHTATNTQGKTYVTIVRPYPLRVTVAQRVRAPVWKVEGC